MEATAPPWNASPDGSWVDVLDGKVSAAAARSIYGVVLDLAAQAIDEVATKELRARSRAENVGKGAVWDRGFENVEEAAADRSVLRAAQGESRALSGTER